MKRLQRGSLKAEGNWWRLRYWEKVVNAEGKLVDKRRTAVIGPAKGPDRLTKKQAEQRAWDNVMRHVNANASTPASLMTVRQFVAQHFEPEYVWSLKPAGRQHYRYCLKWILPALGDIRLADLDVASIQALLRKIVTSTKPNGEQYSVQTAKHVKNAVSAIVEHAKTLRMFHGENPARLTRLPPMQRQEKYALSWEQVEAALDMMPEPIRTMVVLSVSTSLNVAELCGLQWRDINLTDEPMVLEENMILPPRSFIVRRNWYLSQYGSPKTSNRRRIQPLPTSVYDSLLLWRQQSRFTEPTAPVFASSTGRPIDGHNVNNRLFKRISKALGVKVTWHIFRHTCATFAHLLQMPRTDRIALMGHGSSAMTDHYTHSDIERRRDYVDMIAGRFRKDAAPTAEELKELWEKE